MKERLYLTFINYPESLSEYLIHSHDPPHSGGRFRRSISGVHKANQNPL